MAPGYHKVEKRINISTGSEWESLVGYSRAVKAGNIIEVAGTTAVENGKIIAIDDAYGQTVHIILKIKKALEQAGAGLEDVVRTRIYVTDISLWKEVGKAHGEFFGDIRPASTMVEVSKLINPEILVEIEATAVLQ